MWGTGLSAILLVIGAMGCGPAVHNEAAERARQWFYTSQENATSGWISEYRDILDRHPGSLQAGVVFPDWGYGCLSMDDPAETAHWAPFLRHGVRYVISKYPRPYSERGEQLVAFLFGIASHQIADEQWHSLSGLRDGIMRVLAKSTFDGEYSRAHDAMDVGGDFAMAHMSDLRYILDKWTVPMDDVIEIYHGMGISVPRWKVSLCVTRQFYAMEAVKRFGRGLFPSYASRAPMLTERLDDYYVGGIYAMATSTCDCWGVMAEWLETGDFHKQCLVHGHRQPGGGNGTMYGYLSPAQHILEYMWPGDQLEPIINDTVSVDAHDGILSISLNDQSLLPEPFSHVDEDRGRLGRRHGQHVFGGSGRGLFGKEANVTDNCSPLSTLYPKIKQLYTTSAYSGLGTAVVIGDFTGLGQSSVAISAPYFKAQPGDPRARGTSAGAVFVLEDPDLVYAESHQDILDADPLVLVPGDWQMQFPLFGSSLAVVDFNADGVDDLVVGSSGYGASATGPMLGRVDVYLGHRGQGLSKTPDYTLTAEELAMYTDSPWSRQRIGGFLFGEDVNNDGFVDLLIGAPYQSDVAYEIHSGRVYGYISRPDRELGEPDFSLVSPEKQQFEWFGFSARSVYVEDLQTSLLLVGAPGHRIRDPTGNHTLAGKVYVFAVDESGAVDPVDLEFITWKDKTQLGSHIHVWQKEEPLILFGSPSEHNSELKPDASPDGQPPERGWQAGEVRVIDPRLWTTASEGGVAGLLNTLCGVQSPGHFGRALATTESEVWIGEPFSNMENGHVYRWRQDFVLGPQCFSAPNAVGQNATKVHPDTTNGDNNPTVEVTTEEETVDANEAGTEVPYKLTIKAPNGTIVPVIASAQETVQDLKQVVGETPGTMEYSCFYLSLNKRRLNDFVELGEIEGLGLDSELELVEDQYTEREARVHVSRLRDLLCGAATANPIVAGLDAGVSVFSTIKQSESEEHAFKDFELGQSASLDVLSTSKAIKQLAQPLCVRLLVLSGWNPVPRYRQLKGDLLYLLVTTLENQSYHITAGSSGFYVNASSTMRFNAENYGVAHAGQPGVRDPSFYAAHSLLALLRRISPKFAKGLGEVQRGLAERDPAETLPFQLAEQAATPWVARSVENSVPVAYDVGAPQDAYLRQGAQAVDSLRDWNEELQSIREMARETLGDRVLRDRQLHKWHAEFVEAAIPGAMAVVGGELVPLNPTDPVDQHMFLRDNIFYSKGFDGRETFAQLGGDSAAHVATGKDITGVRLLNQLDTQGLHTLGSVVVDYCGVRVVAQSVVPGVFRRQEATPIVYGSVDQGVTVGADAEFHQLLEPVAKALHFAEHEVANDAGDLAKLYTSADVKGLTGTDGRKYVLDLYRMTPVDIEFLESECNEDGKFPAYPHKVVLLRPELVDTFWEQSTRKAVMEHVAAKVKQEKDKEGEDAKDKEEIEEEDLLKGFDFSLSFSPDAFTPIQEKSPADESLSSAVRGASQFLRDVSVPALARDLAAYVSTPLSGDALTATMHQRGINMRCLGRIAELLPTDSSSVRNIRRRVVVEMIARAVKHVLRRLFRLAPSHLHSEVFALVANCLVGSRYCANPAQHLTPAARSIAELAAMTPQTLAEEVRAQVALRFRFALAEDFVSSLAGYETMLLREVCVKIGAQLALRQYYFERPTEASVHAAVMATMDPAVKMTKPVKRQIKDKVDCVLARPLAVFADDVMNFVARTKVATHKSSFADEAFEAGRLALEKGDRALGLEMLLESLALHEQTFGFLHSESARCYSVVSLAHYDAGEYALAAEYMTKAVVISERTVGLDDPLTIHNYLNLALYEHARGNSLLALRLMRHAMDLWSLVNSSDHPDLATAYNNIAVMLQSLRLYDDSLRFFRACLDVRVEHLGADHVLVAGAQHSLAKVYAVTGDFKSAVQVERDAHMFFSSKFGDDDPRSKETGEWLAELTFNAVRTAKLSKAAKEKIREVASTASLMQMEQREEPVSKGHLPIDDLIKFITGRPSSSKPKPSGGPRGKGPKGSRR
ncbi:Intracellular distribution of mitochondria [Coemansia sp. S680]|nr:Intracellular distribution of mitochondria [Coemansia sp. S680]